MKRAHVHKVDGQLVYTDGGAYPDCPDDRLCWCDVPDDFPFELFIPFENKRKETKLVQDG